MIAEISAVKERSKDKLRRFL